MAGERPMVGNAKVAAVAAEIALKAQKKKPRDKKVAEATTRKKLQESRLSEERAKKNA